MRAICPYLAEIRYLWNYKCRDAAPLSATGADQNPQSDRASEAERLAMLEELGLSLYVPNRKDIAHFAKPFPETGKIYIFCTRNYIVGSGRVLRPGEVDQKTGSTVEICNKCIAALEATLERISIIQGIPPPERFNDWVKTNPET